MKNQIAFKGISISFLFLTLIFNPTNAQTNDFQMEILYPLYVYPYSYVDENVPPTPNDTSDDTEIFNWQKVIDAQKNVNITAVINPDSGPSLDSWDMQQYKKGIKRLRDEGVLVLGYVKTGWMGGAPTATWHPYTGMPDVVPRVLWDVNTYHIKYHLKGIKLDGIFFDEANDQPGVKSLYRLLYENVKMLDPNWLVVLNPGYNAPVDYLGLNDNTPVSDIIVSYESASSAMGTQANNSNNNPYNYSAMIHTVTTAERNNIINTTRNNNYGYIFVTDDVMNTTDTDLSNDNPYDQVPDVFWTGMVQRVKAENSNKKKRQYNSQKDRIKFDSIKTQIRQVAIGGAVGNQKIYFLSTEPVEKNSNDYKIYSWDEKNNKENLISGGLVKIAVDGDGGLWGINSKGDVYNYKEVTKVWDKITNTKAIDITVAGKGNNKKVYILNKDKVIPPKPRSTPGGNQVMTLKKVNGIYEFQKLNIDIGAKQIAVDENENLWAYDENIGLPYLNYNGNWTFLMGKFSIGDLYHPDEIYFGTNGKLYAESHNSIYQFDFSRLDWDKIFEVPFINGIPSSISSFAMDLEYGAPWLIKNNNFLRPRIY